MSRHRVLRVCFVVAVIGLGAALTAVLGWGVIGKHRLDDDARDAYKATRVVRSEPISLDWLPASTAPSFGAQLEATTGSGVDLSLSVMVPWRPLRRGSPSRAPPSV